MEIRRLAWGVATLCVALAVVGSSLAAADCGDGIVDAGEACDPGSATGAFAGCCAPDCTLLPDDTTCDDGNVFTTFDRCVQGEIGRASCRERV